MSIKKKDWSVHIRPALSATQIVAKLAHLNGWSLAGKGPQLAIVKTYEFANYFETIAFVNGLALIAHQQDHHPELKVSYNRCVVSLNTHDVQGISQSDFDCASQFDALLA